MKVNVPDGIGGIGKKIACGLGDGKIRFVRLGMNKVVGEVQHDEFEGVTSLDFDVQGRMISGGGQTLKVWREAVAGNADGEDDEEEEEDGVTAKRPAEDSEADSDEEEEADDSSDEEEKDRKRRKKRKRGKGPASSGPAFNFAGLD